MRKLLVLVAILCAGYVLPGAAWAAPSQPKIPVIFDTDIGGDIDDAFALALIINSPELELRGVTTVSGDTKARARLAAKLLWEADGSWRGIPVYAGDICIHQPVDQARWAEGFSSPALHLSGAVNFMQAEINRDPGKITIVAVGELTNVAALLKSDPSIAGKIRQIAIMGGSVALVMRPVQSLTRNAISNPTRRQPQRSFPRECLF